MAIIKAAAAEPIPIPIACLVLMALCVVDPEPGALEEAGSAGGEEDETGNMAVSDTTDVTAAEEGVC